MIPRAHCQETLHRAYVTAVAAQAGIKVEFSAGAEYGVDGEFELVTELVTPNGTRFLSETGYSIDFQLKSTTNCQIPKRQRSDHAEFHYRCEATAYNKLVLRNVLGTLPILLLVLCLPKDQNDWLSVTQNALTLNGVCYWHYVRETEGVVGSSRVIRIPRSQVFTPNALTDIMNEIQKRGGRP